MKMIGKPYAGELQVRFDEGEQDLALGTILIGHEVGNDGYCQGSAYRMSRLFSTLPNRDITWLTMGTPTERLQGLLAGSADAVEASYPIDMQGEKKGYRVLLDLRKEVSYPSMSVVTRRKSIVEDRDTVARMVRAHVEGIAYFKQNKEFSIRVLGKQLRINDREMLENSFETYKQDFISVPYPITKGLDATYDFIAQTRPEIRSRKPDEFVDTSFISELEKSGFIKKLYEQK